MVSYYRSKHPGLALYIALVTLSVLTFALFQVQDGTIGLLSMAWGFYIFLRALSLLEATDRPAPFHGYGTASRETLMIPSALPHDLTTRMDGRDRMKRALFAMNALSPRSLVWLGIALCYLVFEIWRALHHLTPAQETFTLPQKASILFMIGASFWAGQTYAYSDSASKILTSVFGFLFTLCLFVNQSAFTDIPTASLDVSADKIILALLAGYSGLMLLPACTQGKTTAMNAGAGLCLIALMVLCHMVLPFSVQNTALWLSSWSLFSIFWIRAHKPRRKVYRLMV